MTQERQPPWGVEQSTTLKTNSPIVFMEGFRTSVLYSQAYTAFFAGKQIAEDVTEAEKQLAFERSIPAIFAVLTYGEKEMRLTYEPSQFSEQAQEAIRSYIDHVRFEQERKIQGADRSELQTIDSTRSALHGRFAVTLVDDGIVTTSGLGRAIGRLILVDQGLERPGQYKADIDQRERQRNPRKPRR